MFNSITLYNMRQELRNAFGNVCLTVEVDTVNGWVCATWQGYPTPDSIRKGVSLYTSLFKGWGLDCILIDTRSMIGTWDHSLEWMLNKWAPRAARAGLRHYAIVATPRTFAASTATDFHSRLISFEAKIFDEMEAAKAWLSLYTAPQERGFYHSTDGAVTV